MLKRGEITASEIGNFENSINVVLTGPFTNWQHIKTKERVHVVGPLHDVLHQLEGPGAGPLGHGDVDQHAHRRRLDRHVDVARVDHHLARKHERERLNLERLDRAGHGHRREEALHRLRGGKGEVAEDPSVRVDDRRPQVVGTVVAGGFRAHLWRNQLV